MTDEQLMLNYQEGDQDSFQQLFEKYRNRVFSFIYAGYEKNSSTVEELTQEVFIRVIRSRHTYKPEKKFSSWLFTIARNHCLNKLASAPVKFQMLTMEIREEDATTDATNRLEQKELGALIRKKVSELPELQRTIFILRDLEDMSHRDIAQSLGLSETNTRSQYHRAKKQLQTLLKPYLEA